MNDLISRTALLQEFETETHRNHAYQLWHWTGIKAFIESAPAVDAKPVVHGEWENVSDDEEDLCFRCTNCKSEFSCEIDMRQFTKHCPECGADMQKGGAYNV